MKTKADYIEEMKDMTDYEKGLHLIREGFMSNHFSYLTSQYNRHIFYDAIPSTIEFYLNLNYNEMRGIVKLKKELATQKPFRRIQ